MWPFKYINGEQTPESEALEADKWVKGECLGLFVLKRIN